MAVEMRTTRVAAGGSTHPVAAAGAREAAREAAGGLAGERPDLVFLFLSPDHLSGVDAAVAGVHEELDPVRLVGCVADGVVAGERELEEGPAAAVWAASLPGANVTPFHASAVEEDDGLIVAGCPDAAGADLGILLVDPFTFPVAPFLARLNEERPGFPIVGGIASGGGMPGQQAMIVGDTVYEEGAVGVLLSNAPAVTIVSQGCAPIGREAVVTRADENVVLELAGESALERLRADVTGLAAHEQAMARSGILAGLVIDENKPEYGRGDYLMRGLMGVDETAGAIAIGELVRPGQTLRFHVRDAQTADEDLREALATALADSRPAGALLFTCNGRGTNMFPGPHHDARRVREALGDRSLAGFFCGGEIGPVGGRNFLHGFTATLAVFLRD
jgi:small ligand-binding sensory domain FIST